MSNVKCDHGMVMNPRVYLGVTTVQVYARSSWCGNIETAINATEEH